MKDILDYSIEELKYYSSKMDKAIELQREIIKDSKELLMLSNEVSKEVA